MAMEFAITAPLTFAGADDSWQLRARSFLFVNAWVICRRSRTGCGLERICVSR